MKTNPYVKTDQQAKKFRVSRQVQEKVDPRGKYFDESGRLNPRIASKSERYFNKDDKLNAYDKKDAISMIARLLNDEGLGHAKRASYRTDPQLPPEEARRVLLAALTDPTGYGIRKVGEELLAPVKNLLDYEGWARKILKVRPIGQGEIHRIPKDVWVVAFVVGQDGQSVVSQAYGQFAFPAEFKVTAFPEVDIVDIQRMNFDVLARQQDLAKQMIMLKEDRALVTALQSYAQVMNDVVYFSGFNVGTFEDIRYQVERHRLLVDKFVINRFELSSILKNMHGYVDMVTERELLLMGYIGTIFGAQIITSAGTGVQEVVPPGTVFALTEGAFLGEMGVRIELMSEPYTKAVMQETKRGWMFLEVITQGLVNPRAVAMGKRV